MFENLLMDVPKNIVAELKYIVVLSNFKIRHRYWTMIGALAHGRYVVDDINLCNKQF